MKFWTGVTDNEWYAFLAERRLDEVNFWRPSPGPYFTDRPAGTPLLFRVSWLTPWSLLKGVFPAEAECARRSTGFLPLTANDPCR
jgi:hypothetical protein